MIPALALALALSAPTDPPAKLVDGGVCTGLAWVAVPADATATVSEGPDYTVYYVDRGTTAVFGVYVGGFPMVSADAGKTLVEIDGLTVRPSHKGATFQGYIVGNADYLKNHFFGAAFKDDAGDAAFFRRALFGKAAAAKCNPTTGASK